MKKPGIESIVRFFLPHLITAGDYALNIQQRINSLPDKPDSDLAKAALTDADVSIQTYFEVLTLAMFPDAGFLGEEEKSSVNKKYFLPEREFTVVLDPINGTLRYKNGDVFEIILTILDRNGSMTAAMLYVPKIAMCYVGIVGIGAFVVEGNKETLDVSLSVPKSFANTLLVLRAGQLEEKLKSKFLTFDEHRDYVLNKCVRAPYEIFTGAINGFLVNQPHCEDSLPLAFIANLAGFVVTDLDGAPVNFVFNSLADIKPSILIADTSEAHKKIMEAMQEKKPFAKPAIAGEFIDTAQHVGGDTAKVTAWSRWTFKHLKEMRMAKYGGLLGKDAADWRNVTEHLLVVNALAMYVGKKVADAGYALDAKSLDQGSVLHNFSKRKEKEGGISYSDEHKATIKRDILTKAGYPENVIAISEYTGRVSEIFIEDEEAQNAAIAVLPIEKAIVAWADARIRNVDIVSLENARDLNKKKVPKDADFYDKWYRFYKKLESKIFAIIGTQFKPEDISNDLVFAFIRTA